MTTMNVEIDKDKFFNWVKLTEQNWLNIFIAGQVFGGRPNEAPQQPNKFQILEDTLLITFKRTERLWIKNPTYIKFDNNQLTIQTAKIIRWGWYYYGRPQTDLNWCEEIYIVDKDKVTKTELTPLDGLLETKIEILELDKNIPIVRISEY